MLGRMSWATLGRRARAFRVVHSVWSVFGMSSLGYVWVCAVTGRRDRALWASAAFLAVEGAALVVGRGNCPMGPLQAEWGDPVPFFELLLPPRAAKAAVPVLAGASVVGLAVVGVRRPRAGGRDHFRALWASAPGGGISLIDASDPRRRGRRQGPDPSDGAGDLRAIMDDPTAARMLGMGSAVAVLVLGLAYAVTLVIGFASRESPDDVIADPMFTILEVLIIAMMPAIVALFVAVHARAPAGRKTDSLTAVAFAALLAVLTCAVHIAILTLSRRPWIAGRPWKPLVFDFKWPSLVYAMDILAWDVFFPLAILSVVPVFSGGRLATWISRTAALSGVLALAGLSGVALGDMRWRNIGIVGYVPVFLVVDVLLGIDFYRAPAADG
jgi:hypothetical protein